MYKNKHTRAQPFNLAASYTIFTHVAEKNTTPPHGITVAHAVRFAVFTPLIIEFGRQVRVWLGHVCVSVGLCVFGETALHAQYVFGLYLHAQERE